MSETYPDKGKTVKAIVATLLGFFLLASVSILIKLEENGSATIEWIVFIQYGTCLFIISIKLAKNKFRDFKTQKISFHLIRGLAGVFAFTCSAIAMTKIPLVNAVLLNNTTPIFIPLITVLWLKVKFDQRIWWGIAVGFVGIIFILKPSSEQLLKTGDLYGIASGILLGIAYVALKVLTKTESFVTIIFYYSFIAFLLSLPFAIMNWSNPPPLIWIYGILSGIFFMSYLYLLQYAYRFVEAVKLSPFNYSVIVFSGFFDWILFKHIPDALSVFGIILVSAGGLLAILLHEKDNKELKHHWH